MNSPQFAKRTCRPRDALAAIAKRHPTAWATAEQFRTLRGTQGIPDWPEWVYLPVSGWYSIITGGDVMRPPHGKELALLSALGAWRLTQGIYRFDPALYADLVETPTDGDIPCDVLYRMPEWCIYIETPNLQIMGRATVHGVWVHLDDDHRYGPELRIVTDTDEPDLLGWVIPIPLGPYSLPEALELFLTRVTRSHMDLAAHSQMAHTEMLAVCKVVMPLLLYLCCQNAEIGSGAERPANPAPKRTKRGWRLFQAERVTTWDVGVRLGAALRRAYHAAETSSPGDGTHAGPRGHIRRAHWHGFRSGPMKTPDGETIPAERRRFDLRWLPPIPVNLDDVDSLPATVRPVKKS